MAVLIRLRDNESLELNTNFPFTLGREALSSEQINNRLISKEHLKIFYENQKWYIKDMSVNGTYTNHVKLINGTRELHHEDIIQVAKFSYAFLVEQQVPRQSNTEDNVEVIVIDDDDDDKPAPTELDCPMIDTLSQEELSEELSCCICTELYVNPIIVDCGHNFCKLCITKWHATNPRCPTCRQIVTVKVPNVTVNNLVKMVVRKMSKIYQAMRASLINQHKTQLDILGCSIPPNHRATRSNRGRRTRRAL